MKAFSKNKKVVFESASDFDPKRFGLSFTPPMIILEYLVKSKGKLYLKKFRLLKMTNQTPPESMLKYLKYKYPEFFIPGRIKDEQITKLIIKVLEYMKKNRIEN
jgi:hypothetical protein